MHSFLSYLEEKKIRFYRGDSEGGSREAAEKVKHRESIGKAYFTPNPRIARDYASGFGVSVLGDEHGEITVGSAGAGTRKPSKVKTDVVNVRNLGTVSHADFAGLQRKMKEKHGAGFYLKPKHIMGLPSFVSARSVK